MVVMEDIGTEQPVGLLWEAQPKVVRSLLQKWPAVWTESTRATEVIKHKIWMTLELPVRKRAYRVSPQKQTVIEEQLKKMLSNGVIEPSSSAWASLVVLTPRKDETPRFSVDYRGVNAKPTMMPIQCRLSMKFWSPCRGPSTLAPWITAVDTVRWRWMWRASRRPP